MSLIGRFKNTLLRRPTAQQKWDAQWAGEKWSWLGKLDELGHYSLLAGYALHLKPGGALLDVGSGDGVLRERLHPAAFSRYIGVDFAEAVARAQPRVDERTTFVVGDMRTYTPTERFDTIVFNESLYYVDDPLSELARYSAFLAEDGVFLISTHRKPKTEDLWARIAASFPVVDRMTVANRAGVEWICGAVEPARRAVR